MRFAANLKWLFTEVPFEQRFAAAAAAGFTAVEYADPYDYPAARLRQLLDDAGLRQVLINSPAGAGDGRAGLACLPDKVAEFRAGLERGIEYAVALESEFLHVRAGVRPADLDRDRAFARLVVNLAWAAKQAQDTGVRLLLEAQNKQDVPGFVLETQAHAAAVAEAAGAEQVGLLFDAYHVRIDEGDVVPALRTVLPLVRHVQVADPPGRTEPGTGEIDWPALFGTLRAAGYDGWIGCEYRPVTETVAGLGWITELAG